MAATSGAIRAGRAFVELFADDSKLQKTLARSLAKLRAFGSTVTGVGRSMLTVGAVAAAPFALSAKTFADFESAMSRVKALTGAQGDEFQALEDRARELGRTTQYTATQAAEAMSYFALAGFDVQKILTAIGPTLDLAATGQIDIAQAADIAAKVMAGMGIEADQLGSVVDVMAKAMTTANTDLTMLGEAFKYVGPIAKSAGVSLEEITAAIQLLSNAGIQGEQAGSTLRGIILALTSPSAEATKELSALGVEVADAAGNMRPLVEIIADLERGLSGAGSADKLASLGTIFPARQAAGAAELVAQGADRLREATLSLGDSSGTAARVASVQLDNLKGDAIKSLSALEAVAIAVGEALGGDLRKGIQWITDYLGKLSEWIKGNNETVVAIAKTIAMVAALGAGLVAGGTVLAATSAILGSLATGVGLVASLLASVLTPVGLVTVGIGALVAVMVDWESAVDSAVSFIREEFGPAIESVGSAVDGAKRALMAGDLGAAAKLLWLAVQIVWEESIGKIKAQWQRFLDWFGKTWEGVSIDADRFSLEIANNLGTISADEYQRRSKALDTRDLSNIKRDGGAAIERETAATVARLNAEIERLKAALDNIPEPAPEAGGTPPPTSGNPYWDQYPDLMPKTAEIASIGDGTFSTMASRMFLDDSVDYAKDTAENTRESAKELRRIRSGGGLVYGN